MGIGRERRESGVLTPEPKLGEKSMAEFQYQLNYDEASYTMIGYQGKDEHVVIPGTFGGKPVTILYDKLFLGHEEIRSVTIPDSVTDLGEFLFDGCVNLHHLRLPKNLLYLWGYTFVRCGLEEIELPDLLTSIPSYAFKECSQLKRVVCGSGMKKIYPWAFGGCTRLTELVHGSEVDVSPQAFDLNSAILKV